MSLVLYCTTTPPYYTLPYYNSYPPGVPRTMMRRDSPRRCPTQSRQHRPRPKDDRSRLQAWREHGICPAPRVRASCVRSRYCGNVSISSPPSHCLRFAALGAAAVPQRPRKLWWISASMDGAGGGGLARCLACSQSRGWHWRAVHRLHDCGKSLAAGCPRPLRPQLGMPAHLRLAARRLSIGMSGTRCTQTHRTRRKMTTIGAKLSSTLHRGMHGFRLGSGGSCAWPATQSCSFSLHRR